jgi:predicted Zn-dependent protease
VTLGRAAERYPGNAVVYTAIGRVWFDAAAGRRHSPALARALEALRVASRDEDASSEALSLYGEALLMSGDSRRAERVLQEAVSRTPVDPRAYDSLAEASRRLNHRDIARAAAAQYAALTP